MASEVEAAVGDAGKVAEPVAAGREGEATVPDLGAGSGASDSEAGWATRRAAAGSEAPDSGVSRKAAVG